MSEPKITGFRSVSFSLGQVDTIACSYATSDDHQEWADMKHIHELVSDANYELHDAIEAQSTLITELVGALEWYEEQARNCKKITQEGQTARSALDDDGGEIARATLTKAKGAE